MNNRIIWVDIAKGIGVFLVVIGHMPSFPEWLRAWIFSFHMPLFFLLSGYTKKDDKHLSVKDLIVKAFRRNVKPYFYYSIIVVAIDFILLRYDIISMKKVLCDIFIGQGADNILWFFMAMFWVQVICGCLNKVSPKYMRNFITFGIVLTGFILGRLSCLNPLKIWSACYSVGFYIVGQSLGNSHVEELFTVRNIFIALGISVIGVSIVFCQAGYVLDINFMRVNDIFGTYIISLAGILLICSMSYYIFSLRKTIVEMIVTYIEHVGRNSSYYFPLTAIIPATVIEIMGGE